MIRLVKYNILFFILINLCCKLSAQQNGVFQFIGHNFFNKEELLFTEIKTISNSKIISQTETGKSNSFKTTLAYGKVYDIYFTNAKTQKMFLRIYADIPKDKYGLKTTYELNIPFFARDYELFDTSQFQNPFHQIIFDGDSKFVDDTTYMNVFLKKVVKLQNSDTSNYFTAKPINVKQYIQLVGKLSLENDKKSPLKNKTIQLVNKNNGVISKAQTSNHGIFVFSGVDKELADGLTIKLSSTENPNNEKIKLENTLNELVGYNNKTADFIYLYKNTVENKLIEKLTDKDFKYNIGGKLILKSGDFKKIASGKNIYLLNNKGTQIQKVTSDVFGNFVFTKIVPGQSYSIAFDTTEFKKYTPEIYTIKDKFISVIDSFTVNRLNYSFTATSGERFNDLILDDTELKMNVKGRLYGDNKNNPLADLKVLLLNDKFLTVDSATTNAQGDFAFNYMPYNRQIAISANNEKNVLESFNNILVFDNFNNLIKIVSMVKGQRFLYKPLAVEQSRISEIYIDEPWLTIINRKKGDVSGKTIIVENILYDFDKADLLPAAKQTLDKISLALQLNRNFSVELGAHCDSKGNDAYNLKLSEQRANAARNYIISKGIDEDRVGAKGYGELKLLNNCGNTVLCSEDEHAINRRLEFILIFK